jgi:hypothetical protein
VILANLLRKIAPICLLSKRKQSSNSGAASITSISRTITTVRDISRITGGIDFAMPTPADAKVM